MQGIQKADHGNGFAGDPRRHTVGRSVSAVPVCCRILNAARWRGQTVAVSKVDQIGAGCRDLNAGASPLVHGLVWKAFVAVDGEEAEEQ